MADFLNMVDGLPGFTGDFADSDPSSNNTLNSGNLLQTNGLNPFGERFIPNVPTETTNSTLNVAGNIQPTSPTSPTFQYRQQPLPSYLSLGTLNTTCPGFDTTTATSNNLISNSAFSSVGLGIPPFVPSGTFNVLDGLLPTTTTPPPAPPHLPLTVVDKERANWSLPLSASGPVFLGSNSHSSGFDSDLCSELNFLQQQPQNQHHMASWAQLPSYQRPPSACPFTPPPPPRHHQQRQPRPHPDHNHHLHSHSRHSTATTTETTATTRQIPNIHTQGQSLFTSGSAQAGGNPQNSSHTNFSVFHLPQPSRQPTNTVSDESYLSAFATDFSSPSLPPLNSSPRLPNSRTPSSLLPKPLEIGEAMPATLRRSSRGSRGGIVDLTKDEPDDSRSSGIDLSLPVAPRTRKRTATTATLSSSEGTKKRRTSQSSSRPTKSRRDTIDDTSSIFSGFDSPRKVEIESHDSIDLSNADEVPEEFLAPKVDNRVKLGNFQCVICMDDVSALTVTHCGHLFCSECLHSSLHIDSMKKTCPVCRTKVDLKDKKSKNTKSYYHLELKVMTATKKGKQPAR